MRNRVATFAVGLAGAGLLASTAMAQQESGASNTTPETAPDASFDEAFPQMVSDPMVQGDLAPPGPLVQAWDAENVASLIKVIEGIEDEGLDPRRL